MPFSSYSSYRNTKRPPESAERRTPVNVKGQDYQTDYWGIVGKQNQNLFDSPLLWQFDLSVLPLDIRSIFPTSRRTFLEIGFGHGEVLEELARRHPDTGFIGIERRPYRVKKAIKRLQRSGAQNVRLIRINLELFRERLLTPESFDEILVNHPDPWSKRRHEHHRLFQPKMLDWLAQLLKPGGKLDIASDHAEYFFHILHLFERDGRFESLFPPPFYTSHRLPGRPVSRFEQRKRAEGLKVWILQVRKIG
ncbi:MAG: tRNA (guanosine(46)-N7)-methyltransferase TrmB [bacterium]